MKGIVLDIQRCCYNDGPGIRTSVFLKGCMLRCAWCHNPESFRIEPQLGYDDDKCVGCGTCIRVCPHQVHQMSDGAHRVDFSRCIACGKCVEACPVGALSMFGREMEASDVMEQVLLDRKFYENSGGGVTFTGGEPTMQFDFLRELLERSRAEGLHVCLETNGCQRPERMRELLDKIDLLLFDYKLTDPQLHKQYTGMDNVLVEENLRQLREMGKPVILRAPIIPGINDTESHFAAIRALKNSYPNIEHVEIMAYHDLGKKKWEEIGLDYTLGALPNTPEAQKREWEERAGIPVES